MLNPFLLLPRLNTVFPLNNKSQLNQLDDPQQRSIMLRKVIDKIWSSLDLKVILQTVVDEIAVLLNVDRCDFLWYFNNTQQVQVVCEGIGNNLTYQKDQKSWLGSYPLDVFGSAATAIAQGQIIINCQPNMNPGTINNIARFMSRINNVNYASDFGLLGAISNLLVPVKGEDGWLGFIACLSQQPRHWQTAEIEFVNVISQQLEIAIRQAKIYEQSQKQSQRERLVYQITTQTRQSFDIETILTSAIAQLLEALDIDRCIVHLVEDSETERNLTKNQRQHIFEAHKQHFSASITNFDKQGPLTKWVIQHRQAAIIADVTQDWRIGVDNQEYQSAQIKSTMVMPVQANNKLHAILYLNQCSHLRYWSKNDQELAQVIADQLAISLQQAELYNQACNAAEIAEIKAQELAKTSTELTKTNQLLASEIAERLQTEAALHEKNALMQLLQKVAVAANEAATSEATLQICLEQICTYTGWPIGHVYIPDSTGTLIYTDIWFVENPERFQIFREITELTNFSPGIGLPGRVYLNKKPEWIFDVSEDKNFLRSPQANEAGIKAGFAFPVLVGTEVVAVLEFFSSFAIAPDQSLLEAMTNIGTQLGRVIEKERSRQALEASEAKAKKQAQQLKQTLDQLQETQSQLIQTEKMSSLGQLVAGVAHEINNPVNFIHGNLMYVNQYTQDLLTLIELYRKHYPRQVSEIQDCQEAIDLEFLIEDMPKMLTSMKMGTDRIRQIVLSLRNFSRLDEAEMKPVDIHEGIDSTLLILQNRLKVKKDHDHIKIIKEYGDLPKIECYAGKLNQVFMNILANAIDVLEEKHHSLEPEEKSLVQPPEIRIRTELTPTDHLTVRIADNGLGMNENVISRLFDPFFTTKSVGKGTGLGLSISYQIVVEQHGGSLKCISAPGKGTEFIISIPIKCRK